MKKYNTALGSKMKSYKSLKKKLDTVFSVFIRTRDSNDEGVGKCVTCSRYIHWKQGDCGHYIPRQFLSTRWEEKNTALQCKSCNAFEGGRMDIFAEKIDKRWGKGTVGMLNIKQGVEKRRSIKLYVFELEYLINEYKQKITTLKKRGRNEIETKTIARKRKKRKSPARTDR